MPKKLDMSALLETDPYYNDLEGIAQEMRIRYTNPLIPITKAVSTIPHQT
jgi:hypothetical protein